MADDKNFETSKTSVTLLTRLNKWWWTVHDILALSKILEAGFELWVVIGAHILLSLQTPGTLSETLLVFWGDGNKGAAQGTRLKDSCSYLQRPCTLSLRPRFSGSSPD